MSGIVRLHALHDPSGAPFSDPVSLDDSKELDARALDGQKPTSQGPLHRPEHGRHSQSLVGIRTVRPKAGVLRRGPCATNRAIRTSRGRPLFLNEIGDLPPELLPEQTGAPRAMDQQPERRLGSRRCAIGQRLNWRPTVRSSPEMTLPWARAWSSKPLCSQHVAITNWPPSGWDTDATR